MLSNLSELQTITLLHGRIFKKMHIQHMRKSLAKAHANTNLIKSLKAILDYFQPILLICDSGRLMWSLEGQKQSKKNIHLKYCQIKKEIYQNYRDSSKRPWKINVGK
jgi:hypothetical protein